MLKTRTSRAALLLALLVAPSAQSAAQLASHPAETRGGGVRVIDKDGAEVSLYTESHALVVGVSEYTGGWSNLSGVKEDTEKVGEELRRHGFTVDFVLNPTRVEFDRAMRRFVSRYGHTEASRLLVYYAGHGYINRQNYGGSMGYLVPSDAPRPERDMAGFKEAAVSMSEVEVYAREIESRHALFLFDSCFSGALFETRGEPPASITNLVSLPVRQFITAGTAEQTVPDRSVFRMQFVDGLEGAADANGDHYVTGSELGIFLQNTVTDYSRGAQAPRWGKINDPLLDKGDFVFVVPKAAATGGARPATPATPDPRALAEGYGVNGEKLYKGGKYEQSENEFRLAVHFEPSNARWRLGLARSLDREDRDAEAEAAAREAARLAPADAAVFVLLGDVLEDEKKRSDAEAAWRDALLLSRDAARRAPSDVAPLGLVAEALERLGSNDEALVARRDAVKTTPRSAKTHAALSELLVRLNKRDEALTEMREAARLEPSETEWQDELADRLEESSGKSGEALEARRAAIRLDPKNIYHYRRLAYHYGCYGSYENRRAEMIKVFREAVLNNPEKPEAYAGLAYHLSRDNQYTEAEGVLRDALSRLPNSSELYVALGDLFSEQSKAADAQTAYRRAIQLEPNNPTPYWKLGEAYERSGKRGEADTVYREGLNIIPTDGSLFYRFISNLKAQDKRDEVEAAYRRAILRRPYNTELYTDLARFLMDIKKYADAEQAYREAARLDAQNASLRVRLAETLKAQGRTSDAVAAYREAARLDPRDADLRESLAETLKAQGNTSEAIAAYREAVRLRPDIYYYYGILGKYLEEQKDHAGAEALYREALPRLSDQTDRFNCYDNLALMLARQDKHAEAETNYREALRIDPKWAWTHYALGVTLWNLDRLDDAESELREAIKLAPDEKEYRDKLDKFLAERQK
jgi:tetratricopeptide (TPR) repeat protein